MLCHQLWLMIPLAIVACWAPIAHHGLWFMCLQLVSIALLGPWEGGCPRGPCLSQLSRCEKFRKSSQRKMLSDVGPGITLPFPKLIASCLDSQFYFRNKCLLVPFTFQHDSRSALCLCSSEDIWLGPQGSQAGQQLWAPVQGARGKQAATCKTCGQVHPLLWVHDRGSRCYRQ